MDGQDDKQAAPPATSSTDAAAPPKTLAFTIDFGSGTKVDEQRHKALVKKFQNRVLQHKRGQSLSKLSDATVASSPSPRQHPASANLPRRHRKGSFPNNEPPDYCSSDEKSSGGHNDRKSTPTPKLFNLPLMTRSFPDGSFNLGTLKSPREDRYYNNDSSSFEFLTPSPVVEKSAFLTQFCAANVLTEAANKQGYVTENKSHDGGNCALEKDDGSCSTELDNKSDAVSDAGTYTLEADNYSEEQKARMSIDREFNIEEISVMKKTEEYIQSLNINKDNSPKNLSFDTSIFKSQKSTPSLVPKIENKSPMKLNRDQKSKLLSPILSPTQNLSITDAVAPPSDCINIMDNLEIISSPKILYPSSKSKVGINSTKEPPTIDQGCFTSVTSSGAFSRKADVAKQSGHSRQPSLTKSEVQILTYVDIEPTPIVESITKIANLPPTLGGKTSPTKIPSPVHSAGSGGGFNRPRSRNSLSSLNIDLSDSSLETESFLKPTQIYINSLQKRLSLDSDPDSSDYDCGRSRCNNLRLNNAVETQKSLHVRHNSFDEKNVVKISNKLEHFQNKSLQHHQAIDQTYSNRFNQYSITSKSNQQQQQHQQQQQKLQNSPNNSPIRRSSSFSNKNHIINVQPKVSNYDVSACSFSKDNNLRNSPNLHENGSIQRSSSTANIKTGLVCRSNINNSNQSIKLDRSQFADTESSSEDDFEKKLLKKKDFSNLTNTRYNRAFSLRRARLDGGQSQPQVSPRCPNTPEMRRKFQPTVATERAISVDRRPIKNDVQSRYLQISKIEKNGSSSAVEVTPKNVPKITGSKTNVTNVKISNRSKAGQQAFSRVDSGRFSIRPSKPGTMPVSHKGASGSIGNKKQSGGRSNSSLSSREVEFQNWKRRKSYDPMKAAAEGKKKAELAKKQTQSNLMTQSYNQNNQDCDSSPSHSSSVHRSQSFHGTAALEQLISSEEDDLTLSADEGFSPPIPSPSKLSPARTAWKNRLLY